MKSTLKLFLIFSYIAMSCGLAGCSRSDVSKRLKESREAISADVMGFGKSNKSIDAEVARQLHSALSNANSTSLQTPRLVIAYSVNNSGSPSVNVIVHWISAKPTADSVIIDAPGIKSSITKIPKIEQKANQHDAKIMVTFSSIIILSRTSRIAKTVIDRPQVKIALAYHGKRCSNFVTLFRSVGGQLRRRPGGNGLPSGAIAGQRGAKSGGGAKSVGYECHKLKT